ncbi:L-amino acid amidase [Hypsizygus marmoreus]|uniref:L-amino acid amidase n=1 Tax=Hypsizygus marmoreus TaxID=39966 RepID=A0A369JU64_HYPMA|nr:L-amino acid amidase [Hypsizygus marmoreus]
MATSTGKIDFHYQGATYQTWYKLVGNVRSTKAGVRPLIALHGGPGVSHSYMTPHADLLASHGIPVVLYDQIGVGQSSHRKDAPKEFWTVELFMDELESLLNHFGISGDYDLIGHSWGGMLAGNFAAARHPAGLKHLIITNTLASMALWEESTAGLVKQLPQNLQDIIRKHEKDGTTDAPEYQEAMMVFYKQHVCRLEPWPQDLTVSFAAMEEDPTVYHTMLGPSEFTITGTLKTWTIVDKLPTIKCPTLMMNSVFDEAQDVCVLPFFKYIPQVKWVQFANSSHVPFFEERERYMKVVGNFLTKV